MSFFADVCKARWQWSDLKNVRASGWGLVGALRLHRPRWVSPNSSHCCPGPSAALKVKFGSQTCCPGG